MQGPGSGGSNAGADAKGSASPPPIDAAIPDAPPNVIDVIVLPDFAGDTIASLPVVFSASDGSLLGVETTDASGHASHTVTSAASVTVIRPSGNQGTVTIEDVQPGSTLRFGSLYVQYPTLATMTASWPSDIAGAAYDVETRCGGFSAYYEETSGSLVIDNRCSSGTFDATVAEYYNDHVVAYQTLTGQTPVDGGSLAFTGTWTPATQFPGAFTDLPLNSTLTGLLTETSSDGLTFEISDAMEYFSMDGTGALNFAFPPAPGAALYELVDASVSTGTQYIGHRLAYTDPVGFDIGAALEPAITNVSFDATSNTVSWTAAAGEAPAAIRARLSYPGPANMYPTWIIVAPGTATSVSVPQLPDSLAMYRIAGQVQGALALLHESKSYADMIGDIDLWFGRSNITDGSIDWTAAPQDLTSYTAPASSF